MSFLAQTACLGHGQIGTGNCCSGLTAWHYDANTGQAYNGIGCWNAPCASAGQWAGPGGVGNSCCPPLVNVAGRCGQPSVIIPPPISSGMGSSTTMYLMIGGVALLAMMMMKKKGSSPSQ